MLGFLAAIHQAFPCHKVSDRSWNRCNMQWEGKRPSLFASKLPNCLIVAAASWLHPTKVSTAKGMKWIPASWQVLLWHLRFCCSLTAKEYPWVTAASSAVSVCTGEITGTSKAAGLPRLQHGRNMSARQEGDPGISDGISFLGASRAVASKLRKGGHFCQKVDND